MLVVRCWSLRRVRVGLITGGGKKKAVRGGTAWNGATCAAGVSGLASAPILAGYFAGADGAAYTARAIGWVAIESAPCARAMSMAASARSGRTASRLASQQRWSASRVAC